MPITQSLNSKANIKKFTNQDLPFAPQQPVMSSFYAVSTAAQTVINLSFSVDTVNLTDQFFLFVDGKKLRLGASNDYQFTSINASGLSSQVTMNQPLTINLNIQAYMLGLKKESEFGMDNRFVQLYAAQSAGFQGFVDQVSFINVATSTVGAPAAGTFYSTILGRAPMVDLSQDLKVRMTTERFIFQSIQLIQGEQGPNGELVWGNINDIFGQVRFVGYWANPNDTAGPSVIPSQVGDYMEFTFCGTGFNLITLVSNDARDYRLSIDGGAEGSNLYPGATGSPVLASRNSPSNQILLGTNGLAYGVHTAKIRCNNASTARIYGVEILNEGASVRVNPGIGYSQGSKYTSSALATFSPSVAVTGVRGGRTVPYQNGDGTIGTAFNAVNAATLTLSSADHTNEEMVRQHTFREFGAALATDFSLITGAVTTRTFTLADGVTSLVSPSIGALLTGNNLEGIQAASSNEFHFTFVGCGLDIVLVGDGSVYTGNSTLAMDGTDIVTNTANATIFGSNRVMKVFKVASGLPFGTHTFKLANTSNGVNPTVAAFRVYQPKKPTIPSAAIELADFCNVATYSNTTGTGATTADLLKIPTGTIFKSALEEFVFVGTWSIGITSFETQYRSGASIGTTTNGDSIKHVFYGTGTVLEFMSNSGGFGTFTVAFDGTLNASGNVLSSGILTNNGGGTYTGNISASTPARLEFTGLTLGVHTVTITKTSASANTFWINGADVICPIYAYKSNVYAEFQNSLPIGNAGIADTRKLTPVKDVLQSTKAFAQATGITSGPTTTSTSPVPFPDMSTTIKTKAGKVEINYTCVVGASAGGSLNPFIQVYLNGSPVGIINLGTSTAIGVQNPMSGTVIVPVGEGTHQVDLFWWTGGNTVGSDSTRRILTVKEL